MVVDCFQVLMKIQKADPPTLQDKKHWSKLFHDFLTKCLQKSPESRLPADQLIQVDISYVLLLPLLW